MSTFAELVAWPGKGVNYLLEVSTDRFATVAYRYSLTSMVFGGQQYEGRIVDVGNLQRGFGVDGLYAAGTVALKLANADGALDWMTAPSLVGSTVLRARWRLSLVVFDPTDPTDAASRVLGVFTSLDWPRRDDAVVMVSLADDALGDAAELATAPTYAEVFGSPVPLDYVVDKNRPVQLAFGGGGEAGAPTVRVWRGNGGGTTRPLVLYATTQPDAAGATPPNFWCYALRTASGWVLSPNPGNTSGAFLYEIKTTGPIVKDGKTWYVHWVQLNLDEWWKDAPTATHLESLNLSGPRNLGGAGVTITNSGSPPDDILDAVGPITAWYWPGSSRSFVPVNTTSTYDAYGWGVTGSDVIFDLLTHYSKVAVADIVTATFDTVRDAWPGARVNGVISDAAQSSELNGESNPMFQAGRLRAVLREVCRSSSTDLYAGWDGKLRVAGATADYTTIVAGFAGTLPVLEETRVIPGTLKVATPSPGERWAPYNRLYLSNAEGRVFGPFDNEANITAWGKPIPRSIEMKWVEGLGSLGQGVGFATGQSGWASMSGRLPLESKVRAVVKFRYPLDAVLLDLADYFVMSVTRGGSGFLDSYSGQIWRVEALTVLGLTGLVEVTAVSSSDLITETAYLLDDETLQVVTSSAGHGGNPQVVNGSTTINFTGGSLITAGVLPGDILVLKDGTESALGFDRNRGLLIDGISSATALKINSNESTFFGGSFTVATWEIRRGKFNLPTGGGSYPDGSAMYGANCVDGLYTYSGDPANRFKAG